MTAKPKIRDYFAEMYIAGKLADAGWNVYFPKRDKGFDLIAMIGSGADTIVRPVQVKGLYPSSTKLKKNVYGFVGRLSARHPEMALALVYFPTELSDAPRHIAWMPEYRIVDTTKGHRCQPAKFNADGPIPRRDFELYFDDRGLERLAGPSFSKPAQSA